MYTEQQISISGERLVKRRLLQSTVILTLVFAPNAAWTQEQAAEVDGESVLLDTIYVTARRHSENAQSVPISMDVLEGQKLKEISSVSSNSDIARSTPNFVHVYAGTHYRNRAIIRGVGSLLPMSPDDTSVVFNMDEVPTSGFGPMLPNLDLERIEVLRGPQGTLYGRGAQAGAVNFIPKRPGFERELELRAEVGTFGWHLGELVANVPLVTEKVSGRLALQYSQREGDIRNVVIGGEDGDAKVGAARASLLALPGPNTTALVSFNYNENDGARQNVLRDASCYPCSGSNPPELHKVDNRGVTLRVEHDFTGLRLTSLSSVQGYSARTRMDLLDELVFGALGFTPEQLDGAHDNILHGKRSETDYLQEFRLSSREEDRLKWTVGVNLFRSEYGGQNWGENVTFPGFQVFSGELDLDLETNSYAAFGEVTVPLVGKLSSFGGLRLTYEEKEAHYQFRGDGAPGTVARNEQNSNFSDTFVTGRAGLSYEWSGALMTYASVGRGAVAGGFPTSLSNIMFGKEEPMFPTSMSWTLEAGFKSMFWDGRATINGALFYNDVGNGHLMSFNPDIRAYEIATLDYESYGGELEARLQLTPELGLFGGMGYTHTELKDVPERSTTGAISGNAVPNVPAFTGSIGAEYRMMAERLRLGGGEVFLSGTYQYVGHRAVDVRNSFDLDAYGIVNGRAGWEGEKAGLYVFGLNLFDERYEVTGGSYGVGAEMVRPGTGRTLGVGATIRF
ncbi:MAG: TonB-dependent receptor [Parvibaculaceae bacterium]